MYLMVTSVETGLNEDWIQMIEHYAAVDQPTPVTGNIIFRFPSVIIQELMLRRCPRPAAEEAAIKYSSFA